MQVNTMAASGDVPNQEDITVTDVTDQEDGEKDDCECCDSCNIMKTHCVRLYQNISDDRPRVTEENDDARFWNERAKCSRFCLFFPLFTALLFLVDVGMDCEIAVTHYRRGDHKWAAYTMVVIVFSLVMTDSLSALFYIDDQRNPGKTEWLARNNLGIKTWFYALHFIFCGRLIRCFQIFKTVLLIRGIQIQHEDNTQRYRLYISQLQDLSILGVVEAFTEEAPQVALQLYIIIQRGTMDWTSFTDVFVAINIMKSLILFSFSLLSFCRYLRLGNENSKLLELLSCASFFHFCWRLFMLVARVLALVVFASSFQQWVFVVVAVHLLFSYFLLRGQPDNYFEEGSLRDILLRFAFTCINVFCFFPLAGDHTRKWAIPYYLMTFVENSILVLVWYFLSNVDEAFQMIVLITEWSTFLLGIVSVLLYYGVFHPSLKDRNKADKNIEYHDGNSVISFNMQFESTV